MTSSENILAIVPRSLDDVQRLAKSVSGSALLPDLMKKEPDVIMAVMTGLELGLTPMAALRGIQVIKGKPCLSADTMAAVVLASGKAEYFECVEEVKDSVTYETKRVGGRGPHRATWSMEDTKRAGLHGDSWNKYPTDMMHARCKARLARRVYPDVLSGVYTPDEIQQGSVNDNLPQEEARLDAKHSGFERQENKAIEAEIVSFSKASSSYEEAADQIAQEKALSLVDKIYNSESNDHLKSLIPELNSLPKGSPERASGMHAYKEQLKKLEK